MRVDDYVSADGGDLEGVLVTPPLIHRGKRLELNVDTSVSGYVQMELLDIYGSPPLGYGLKRFSLGDCERIVANSTRKTVKWNGSSDVSSPIGKPIHLHEIGRASCRERV